MTTSSGTPESPDHHEKQGFRPLLRTQAELEATWRRLMEPLGFSRHSLWLMLVDAEDRAIPHLTEIEGAVAPPTPEEAAELAHFCSQLVHDDVPGARVALLRTGPGRGGPDDDDRAWARALVGALRDAGVASDVVHVATDTHLVPLPLDALGAA